MNHATKEIVVFVAGVDNAPEIPDLSGTHDPARACAYGIFYDSTRFNSYNTSHRRHVLPEEELWALYAVWCGILKVVKDSPHYYNLIIETDDYFAVSQLKKHAHARAKKEHLTEKPLVAQILNSVEARNMRGDYFVDFICSKDDPTAQKGLTLARKLAEKALADLPPEIARRQELQVKLA